MLYFNREYCKDFYFVAWGKNWDSLKTVQGFFKKFTGNTAMNENKLIYYSNGQQFAICQFLILS